MRHWEEEDEQKKTNEMEWIKWNRGSASVYCRNDSGMRYEIQRQNEKYVGIFTIWIQKGNKQKTYSAKCFKVKSIEASMIVIPYK